MVSKNTRLIDVLNELQRLSDDNLKLGFSDRVASVRQEYSYMIDFMRKGYSDPMRVEMYQRLQKKAGVVLSDLNFAIKIEGDSYFQSLKATCRTLDTTSSGLIDLLKQQPEDRKAYYSNLSQVFNALLLSPQWTEQDARLWTAFLLASEVSSETACVVVSAITISSIMNPSIEKFRTLANVYMMADDESLRQRALVGWFFACDKGWENSPFCDVEADILKQIGEDERVYRDVIEMLMQMVRCSHADKDDRMFQSEIMPKIMDGQPLKVTKNGIIEKDEDMMEDILHPGASERRMDEMEANVKKLLAMQKEGSDIYFKGFSSMKRYPFFYNIMNWFLPFSEDIPEVDDALSRLDARLFVSRVLKYGPFCNSDKFSLVFTFSHVMSTISDSVKQMMNDGELAPVGMMDEESKILESGSYLRRLYIQDLYRFFRLFPQHSFPTIFHKFNERVSCLKTVLGERFSGFCAEYASYLVRQEELHEAIKVIVMDENQTTDSLMVLAYAYERLENYLLAIKYYNEIVSADNATQNEKALAGVARCRYSMSEYAAAAEVYDTLRKNNPDVFSYNYNYLMSAVNAGNAKTVMNDIYRYDFEMPDDIRVKRLLGWALLMKCDIEKADKVLSEIVSGTFGPHVPTDVLNFAYARIIADDVPSALKLLADYINEQYPKLSFSEKIDALTNDIIKDIAMFRENNITEKDLALIIECIAS